MSGKVLALSFDDGPDLATPAILDVLAEHAVHATFFVLGRQVRGHEEMLVRIRDEGHELGNHTFSHLRLPDATPDQIEHELASTSAEIERVTGIRPGLMRPPFGIGAQTAARLARRLRLEVVLWTNAAEDWGGTNAEVLAARLLDQTVPNDVVLLHDGAAEGGNRQETLRALHIVIPAWLDAGYQVVTVSELFRLRPWSGRRPVIVESNRLRKGVRLALGSLRSAASRTNH